MPEPLITKNKLNNDNEKGDENFAIEENDWEGSSKTTQMMVKSMAKILGKKKFQKSPIQQHDDQIVTVVQEVYLSPENRQDVVGDWILDKESSHLVHAAYKHRTENRILICYRGTDFKNMKDLFSDVQIVLGVNGIDDRVQQSLDFFDEIQMKYPDAKKWVCGHSLGGTISYIVTRHRSPDRCIVFNPGAGPTKSFLMMMKDTLLKKDWTKTITTYKIRGDVISTLGFVGNVESFTISSANPLKLHSIDSFPELFKKEK